MVIVDPLLGPADPVGMVMVVALLGCKLTSKISVPFVNVAAVAAALLVGVSRTVACVAVGLRKITRPDPVMVIVLDAADKS
jgi:hypothetical protein